MSDKRINIAMTEDEKRRFRMEAARRETSMSELGRKLLSEWLEENAAEPLAE